MTVRDPATSFVMYVALAPFARTRALIDRAHAARSLSSAAAPCEHSPVVPAFDPVAAARMSAEQVRRSWPRFMGECPVCGENVIMYASAMHYIAGDW